MMEQGVEPDTEAVPWEPPGRGRWTREVVHFPGGQTPLYRAVFEPMCREGLRASMARYGVLASHLAFAHVNDHVYVRGVPIVEPPRAMGGTSPPPAAMWLLSRIVPQFWVRTRAARRTLRTRRWREDGQCWLEHAKPALEARCLALGDERVGDLDDDALARHLERALALLADGTRQHFELLPSYNVPVGDLVATGERWNISGEEMLAALAGSSPASAESATALRPVADALAQTERRAPNLSLDDLRGLGPDAERALDVYLRRHGDRIIGGFDFDQPTLVELPNLVVRTVESLAERVESDTPAIAAAVEAAAALRERVPQHDRALFDDLLGEARYAYGLRDDDASITLQWTAGLVRRAALEAGRRLVTTHRVSCVEHVFELQPDELVQETTAQGARLGASPTEQFAAALAERAARRRANLNRPAPAFLGPEEPIPPLDPLPKPLRRVSEAVLAYNALSNTQIADAPLAGTGVGERVIDGRARSASTPSEAFSALEDGDILVVPFTTPAYNAVLPGVAGLIVEEGGPLSHAALVARELGIPAVIGVAQAVARIPDGSHVRLDPIAGRVTLL